ncbi:AGAP004735-PA-like protein [Anopheles sinensis]|uniref:AGAP004735-PA-like protein n=1 Tax=Anopheles sinensis TaxID=74873 RepID=A0A084VZT9_ANOSI|nr:AGAP004735-PA-like protein [Anopheles sinensis]
MTKSYRDRNPEVNCRYIFKQSTADRLTIQKIHSLIDIPTMKGLNMHLNREEIPENYSKESRIIYWQEKVFSQHELKYYGFKENCKTEHQKTYYKRFKLESHVPSMLFTYVEGDNFSPDDLDNPTQHRFSHIPDVDKQSMYLMADLGEDVLMFSIQWFPKEGILLVYPDFNRMCIDPYYHEVRGSNLQMYHYSLEKCTSTGDILEAHNIPTHVGATSMNKILDALPLARDERFIMPKHLKQNVLILLEIVSATAFKYDEIHVRYQIVLPNDVKTTDENATLLGSTHSSKNKIGYWQFGHCHELFLIMSECEEMHNSGFDIFFEVISIDSWQREKYLGYVK